MGFIIRFACSWGAVRKGSLQCLNRSWGRLEAMRSTGGCWMGSRKGLRVRSKSCLGTDLFFGGLWGGVVPVRNSPGRVAILGRKCV